MAAPTTNTRLQTALTQYGTQPGVSAQDVAQLQAAIVADADLLRGMNSAAAAGKLTGFVPATAGATSPTLGTLDTQTGVVTLPTLQQAGSSVTGSSQSDLTATLKLQEMNLRFAQQPGVTADMVRNLQATFNGSPVLVDQTLQRVHAGDLKHLALHTQGVAGGSYSPGTQTMNLMAGSMLFSTSASTALDQQRDLTFVLGHELQHGANRQTKAQDVQAASAEMHRVARDPNPVNDYTAGIAMWQQAAREDEAKAHLSGWNALLSMEKERRGNPNTGLAEMWGMPGYQAPQRVADFMEQDPANPGAGIPKPGLTFNLDGTLSPTPANVAATGRHYYNQPPLGAPGVAPQNTVGIGHHGDSDYANTTGAAAVSHAIEIERRIAIPKHGAASQMRINMQQLGLDETLLERNGLDLRVNTGTRQPYVNTGNTPATPGNFDHTHDPATHPNDGHRHVPVDHASVPGMRRANDQQADMPETARDTLRTAPQLNEPAHPDHAMFRQILSGVHAEDRKRGREPDAFSEQVAAGLTVDAKARGLSSIGFLQFSPDGSKAYITDTQDPSAERARTAVGDIGQAAQQSMGASSEKLTQLNESLAMKQEPPAQQQIQQQNEDAPSKVARAM